MADDSQNQEPSKKSAVDKIIMGAIIGTAIGSAVGFTMAPKKGKEMREEVKEISKDTASGIFRLGKAILRRLFKGKKKVEERDHRTMKELPNEMEILPPERQDKD
jgi:gas vesicle protein